MERFTALAAAVGLASTSCKSESNKFNAKGPRFISTWANQNANETAYNHLKESSNSLLDAIEKGINYVEADPEDTSVGLGGGPDRNGDVTLDACIMDDQGNAGSVTFLKEILHPVSVARLVMEETPHVILSGQGAQDFALSKGHKKTNLLTERALQEYQKWLKKAEYKPVINIEAHDTIGMLGYDADQNLSGACSTSGLAYKIAGRVGDSPIIGAGLFVDNEIGAATATGLGEIVLKTCATFLVVELMRQGETPENACKKAILRMVEKYDCTELQVGLIALNKAGEYGGFAVQKGFNYAVTDQNGTQIIDSDSYYT